MDPAVLAARVLLAAVFAVAGTSKLRDPAGTRRALAEFGVPGRLATRATTVLPWTELAVAAALLVDLLSRAGAIAAALLLAAFTWGIVNALTHGRAPDCGCFGNLASKPVSGWTVARNVLLLCAGGFVAADPRDIGLVPGLVAALGVGVAVALAWRSDRPATVAGMGAAVTAMPLGLDIGTPAPDFSLPAISGEARSLSSLRERGVPIGLIFLDSGCGSCGELHPHLRRWQRALRDRLSLAVVMRGEPAVAEALAEQHGVTDVLVDTGGEPLSAQFRIQSTPSAVIIGLDGEISSSPARGPDAIEELVRVTIHRAQNGTWPASV